jgi:two-component system NtrC family sensor kinase
VERALLDINTVVANAVQLRTLDLHNPNIKTELQLESVLPSVRGDGNQLMQVFFNIISNAVDAMENSGGVLTIKTMRNRGNVVVLFTDSGPGMKEPARVFDPFYTTKPVGKGTGLGLSICFGIMQEHGGKISCYNGERGGAVFRGNGRSSARVTVQGNANLQRGSQACRDRQSLVCSVLIPLR